jgi:hypothetical protein
MALHAAPPLWQAKKQRCGQQKAAAGHVTRKKRIKGLLYRHRKDGKEGSKALFLSV